jgi:hypothetical protein
VWVEEPRDEEPAKEHRLREDREVETIERRRNHPEPRAIPAEEDLSPVRREHLDAAAHRQQDVGRRLSGPET